MALVERVPENNPDPRPAESETAPLSLSRPKVGEVPERIGRIETQDIPVRPAQKPPSVQPRRSGLFFRSRSSAEKNVPPHLLMEPEVPNLWDSRFALFFVLLLVGVNLVLVALIHNSHHKIETPAAGLGASSASFHDTDQSFAVTPPEAAAKAELPPAPRAEATAPATQTAGALMDLPSLAPAAGPASSAAPAPAVAAAPTPSAAPSPAETQDLLSIISKE